MNVKQSVLVALCVALGWKTAGKWDGAKLATKLKEFPELDTADNELTAEQTKLYKKICKDPKAVVIVAEEPSDEEDDAADVDEGAPVGKAKKEKGEPAAKKAKGAGIIGTIVAVLTKASAKKPVTKEEIHKVLQETYPEREAKGMLSTIHIQVPNRLRNDKKLNVQKSDKGFWIEGGSDNAEPEAKPAKAKKEKASK